MNRSKYKIEIEDLKERNLFLERELRVTKEKFIEKARSLCKEVLVVGAVCNLMDDYNTLIDPNGKSEFTKKYKILSECRNNSFKFLFAFLDGFDVHSELLPRHKNQVEVLESYRFNDQGQIETIKERNT